METDTHAFKTHAVTRANYNNYSPEHAQNKLIMGPKELINKQNYINQQRTMAESIKCNYARVAIRHFSTKHLPKSCRFAKGSISKILTDYNNRFVDNQSLRETYSRASKKFPAIYQNFNRRWQPTEKKEEYLVTFSVVSWQKLSPEEKQQHSLQNCKACGTQYQTLSSAFPCKK